MAALRGLRTSSIKKGTILYHGTSAEEDFEIPEGPAWFSDGKAVARAFSGRGPGNPRILRFEVVRRITGLIHIVGTMAFDRMVEMLARQYGENPDRFENYLDVAQALCDRGHPGWAVPWNYPDGSDIMLCRPAGWLSLVGVEMLHQEPA